MSSPLICYIWIDGKLIQISWNWFRFLNMLVIYVNSLFNQIVIFLISYDWGGDWIIIFICLVSEGKHSETAVEITSNLWFDIWMFKVTFLNYQWTFSRNFQENYPIVL